MKVVIYDENSKNAYHITVGVEKDKIWISNSEAEGGDFPVDEVSNVIYKAIDVYFKEKL